MALLVLGGAVTDAGPLELPLGLQQVALVGGVVVVACVLGAIAIVLFTAAVEDIPAMFGEQGRHGRARKKDGE